MKVKSILMKKYALLFSILFVWSATAQEVITLPNSNSTDLVWNGGEKEYYSEIWETQVITNVSDPSMEVFRASPMLSNGTAVIIAPGGGLFAHSILKEGNYVAQWLSERGITAFVLKYRLYPTGEDGVKEIMELQEKAIAPAQEVLPLATQDGMNALAYVRKNAKQFGIDPDKVGFMGFSAGGAVTLGVTFESDEGTAPDFIVPVYPWMSIFDGYVIPEEGPPMLAICASDDPLLLAADTAKLYTEWIDEGHTAELHMYSKGGHGFGMQRQGLPSDGWIERFYEWAIAEGLVISKAAN